MNNFQKEFMSYVAAGYQLLFLQTSEETRVLDDIHKAIKNTPAYERFKLVTWDAVDLFGWYNDSQQPRCDPAKHKAPHIALNESLSPDSVIVPNNAIVVFKDMDDYFNVIEVRRLLQNIAEKKLANSSGNSIDRRIIITSAVQNIPEKLRQHIAVIDYKLPRQEDLQAIVSDIAEITASSSKSEKDPAKSQELVEQAAAAMLGMTATESENCVARSCVLVDGFNQNIMKHIKDEKAAIIKKSSSLTYIPEDSIADRSHIGGADLFLSWLDDRKLAYTKEARSLNIDYPKGVALIGPPGSGKSLIAKAACRILNLPGYVLDIGSLFGSKVGETEQRTRDVIKQIEAQEGCVVVFDEIDKSLANSHDSKSDGGVTQRALGNLLTWLAEKQSRTFVIATLNRPHLLPPELLRSGRFDQLFYTELPSDAERLDIIRIHLSKRGVNIDAMELTAENWADIAEETKNFVGAELETLVVNARYKTFAKHSKGEPTFVHMIEAARDIKPVATRDETDMTTIMKYCEEYATPVSVVKKTTNTGKAGRTVKV